MGASDPNISLFARLLIMAYGCGVAVLGIHPLEHKHGGTINYVKGHAKSLWETNWVPEKWKRGNKIEVSLEKKDEASGPAQAPAIEPYIPKKPPPSPQENRAQLEKIFDSVAK